MLGENAVAIIRKNTTGLDLIGSLTTSSTTALAQLRGKFEKFESSEAMYNGRKEIMADFVFYCDMLAGIVIDETMTAEINGKQYSITFVDNRGMMNTTYKLYLSGK